jgi:Cellulase (glycosyl hydrolase family 5)
MTKSRFISLLILAAPAFLACGSGSADVIDAPDAAAALDSTGGDDAALGDDSPSTTPQGDLTPDDASAFTGFAGDGGPCRPAFASGVNVAWISFAHDVPNPELAAFKTLFQNTHAAGGRVVRWWFHTDGSSTPGYDATGLARSISPSQIADVKNILDTARAAGMLVTISLWSFDMLKGGPIANNTLLLTNDTNRQAYIDNVLTPLATALKGYPGLYSWETFNEPEGMTRQFGWVPSANKIDEAMVQKSVNWFAAAIHDADPSALVTNGTWQFRANANAGGMANFYSDSALQTAGGRASGTLDYYEVHYYASDSSAQSPFVYPASHWALDKPVVIGEFYALDQTATLPDGGGQLTVRAADTYTTLYDAGYAGAWSWQYQNNDNPGVQTKWPSMRVPMQNLFAIAPDAVTCP